MSRRATTTVVSLILILVLFNWSRLVRTADEPAFLLQPPGIWVELGAGFAEVGMSRQFNDDCRLEHVIALTDYPISGAGLAPHSRIESGRRIDLVVQDAVIESISLSWMSAGKRVALGVPLHPDRMDGDDWQTLPGIGPKLAARIERDRQENGDFGSLEGLRRVKGIGERKISAWRELF